MPFIMADGLTVSYELLGPPDAPVVLFANSLGTSFHLWDAQVAALAGTHRVLRYDMRGHGLTETGAADTTSVEELAADAAALLDALAIDAVRFVGLSIGGLVGQRFAAAYPKRTTALVLCATANRIGPPSMWDARIATVEAGGLEAIADAVMQRWFTPATHRERPELIRGFKTMLVRTPAVGYVAACRALQKADLQIDDTLIACPTLVVAGAEDAVTTPQMATEMAHLIPGARLRVLDGAAHILCAEAPAALNAELLSFLSTAAPQSSVGAR